MGFIKVSVCVLVLALVYGCLQRLFTKPLPVVVDGYVHPAFQPVLEKFRENVASGREPGAAFAVYRNGQPLVDVWGGYADVEAARPWRQDTMTQGWSTTKGIAAIVVAVMVDRGWLDYKRPVHEYWPEFKQNGKKNITVEMLLTHQAGLPVLDTPISVLDIREEPERVEKILATQAPVWAPGTQFGYHAITFGPYIDTLVRKADPKRRRMEQIFREEIGEPLDIDVYMNLPRQEYHRAARLYTDPGWMILLKTLSAPRYSRMFAKLMMYPGSLFGRAVQAVEEMKDIGNLGAFNDPDVREITISSISGTMTARGVAKLYSIMAEGVKGRRIDLLSSDVTSLFTSPLVKGTESVIGADNWAMNRGFLYYNNSDGNLVFGHPGHGGQIGGADPKASLGFGYVTNHLSIYGVGDDPRYVGLEQIVYKCLKDYDKSEH
ncbi:beta-lactamase domain-containing protein 2-like [Mya arenaria]|uniref:beta-lactamase domain-containing protein 2-like n=1 Tax=Mya arenaria TaxID=6604 RepID=UPI0022E38478|nr:beta-lactamase domain-containing protein 2-like [Mya arenaria]